MYWGLKVAVRCRPLSKSERAAGGRTITRLVDDKVVVVMNPEEEPLEGGEPDPRSVLTKVKRCYC
jgi:hypothetical protein